MPRDRPVRPLVPLAAICVLAATLRLLWLGEKSFWGDEGLSYTLARMSSQDFIRVLLLDRANMALYLTALRGWIHLGTSEATVRGFSVIWSVATIPVVHLLARRLFGARAALIAALLLAVNGYHIWYAQEARSYSLVVFLVSLSFLFLHRAIGRNSRGDWYCYVMAAVLAVYSHFFAILVFPAHLAFAACLRPSRAEWQTLITAVASVALLTLPLTYLIVAGDMTLVTWIPPTRVRDVPALLVELAGTGSWPLLLAYSIFGLMPVVHVIKRRPLLPEDRRVLGVLSWFALPIVLALCISQVKPMFVYRYLLVSQPPFVLLTALGISRLPGRRLMSAALIGTLALAARGAAGYYEMAREDWRGTSAYLLANARPDDAAVFYLGTGRRAFDYYRDRAGAAGPEIVFPTERQRRTPAGTTDSAIIAQLPHYHPRVWVVLAYVRPERVGVSRAIRDSLGVDYELAGEQAFAGVNVLMYKRRPGR